MRSHSVAFLRVSSSPRQASCSSTSGATSGKVSRQKRSSASISSVQSMPLSVPSPTSIPSASSSSSGVCNPKRALLRGQTTTPNPTSAMACRSSSLLLQRCTRISGSCSSMRSTGSRSASEKWSATRPPATRASIAMRCPAPGAKSFSPGSPALRPGSGPPPTARPNGITCGAPCSTLHPALVAPRASCSSPGLPPSRKSSTSAVPLPAASRSPAVIEAATSASASQRCLKPFGPTSSASDSSGASPRASVSPRCAWQLRNGGRITPSVAGPGGAPSPSFPLSGSNQPPTNPFVVRSGPAQSIRAPQQ